MPVAKVAVLDSALYFRWASADGAQLEQWNLVKQRWLPSSREVYLHCLRSGDAVVMNPARRLEVR